MVMGMLDPSLPAFLTVPGRSSFGGEDASATQRCGQAGSPIDHSLIITYHFYRCIQEKNNLVNKNKQTPSNRSPPATLKSAKATKGDLLEGPGTY